MSKQFIEALNKQDMMWYIFNINVQLLNISEDDSFNSNIRSFASDALLNDWNIEKKIQFLNNLENIL